MCGAGGIIALVNVVPRTHRPLWDAWHNSCTDDAQNIQPMLAHGDAVISKYGGISFRALIAQEFGYANTCAGDLAHTTRCVDIAVRKM